MKNRLFIAAAMAAALGLAGPAVPTAPIQMGRGGPAWFGKGKHSGGRRGGYRGPRNEVAREHGIPKAFRRYAKRYGGGVESLIQEHAKTRVPMLDYRRDRRERLARMERKAA